MSDQVVSDGVMSDGVMSEHVTLTADKEESLLRGYIPWDHHLLDTLKSDKKIDQINFAGNGYFNDGLLHMILDHGAKKGSFKELTSINLLGCEHVTDHGMRCLATVLQEAVNLREVNLDGCKRLSDDTFAMLENVTHSNKTLSCYMRGTDLVYLTGIKKIKTHGCPKITADKKSHDNIEGHILLVPEPGMKNSFAEFLYSGTMTERNASGTLHISDLTVNDSKLTLTELSPSNVVFEHLTCLPLSQVVIPVDAASEPADITRHVMDTISQVVAKEPIWVPYPETSSSLDQSSKRPFLCTHILTGLNLKQAGPELTLHNIPKHDVTKIGVWVSSERLTRSHPSFKLWAPKMEDESGLLIGCLYDLLYCDNNPMSSKSEYGGFLDGIEMKEDMTVEFGVEGNWLSEYVPASDAEFYYVKNGVKSSGKLAEDMPYLKPCGSMYPLVSVVSKTENMAIMPPFIQPPKELSERWQKEDRWIEKSFTENCLIDRNGILTYTPSYKSFPGGQFRGRSLAFEEHREFQVEIINLPTDYSPVELAIGLTAERDENQHYIVCISATLDPVSKGVSVSSKCIQSIHDGSTKNVTLTDVGFKVGDVFKVKWMPLSSDGKNEVSFYAGAQKLVTVDVEFPTDQNVMPLVSFKCQDNTSVVKLLNYRPNYRAPAPLRNKITLGRAHYCNVMDDGQIIYKTNVDKESGSTTYFGHFISKTPFNRELLEFSVKVMEMDDGRLFGIGISEPDVTTKEVFIGWLPGTVGYHADNGQLYAGSGSGTLNFRKQPSTFDCKIQKNDVVTVKIVPAEGFKLQFDMEGNLDSQQTVLVEFYKNDVLVHSIPHTIFADGLYPALSLRGATVELLNFYPETDELWKEIEQMGLPKVDKKEQEDPSSQKFHGTEFLVVALATSKSDPAGKLQVVQQQLDFNSDWLALKNVTTAIKDMERDLSLLDFEDQVRYGRLANIRDNMKHFQECSKNRIHFKGVNLALQSAVEDRKSFLDELVACEKRFGEHRAGAGFLSETSESVRGKILSELTNKKVMTMADIEHVFSADKDNMVTMAAVQAILKHLQSKGRLLILEDGEVKLIADLEYVLMLQESVLTSKPAKSLLDTLAVPAIGKGTIVWDRTMLNHNIIQDVSSSEQVYQLLITHLALVGLPCLRNQPSDVKEIYFSYERLINPAIPLSDFWTPGMDRKDFIIVKQMYKFLIRCPEFVLPLIAANTVQYGRLIMATSEGVVYQNGAVQTVIVQEKDKRSILVESCCYMPSIEELTADLMSKETPAYVTDYTFHVFSIFTDIITDLLARLRVTVNIVKEYPQNLVKTSVACKHDWRPARDSDIKQTVCTLCNRCCGKGTDCEWNGIVTDHLRHCECGTQKVGCNGCGICRSCANHLWSLKARLRPHALMMAEVTSTISNQMKKKETPKSDSNDKADGTADENKVPAKQAAVDLASRPHIPLDPHVFNEVEFINLGSEAKFLCLKEESDGSITKVFPGSATHIDDFADFDKTAGAKPDEFRLHGDKFRLHVGDHIRLHLSDPSHVSLETEKAETGTVRLPIEPQYFVNIGREVKVIHETGIVVYDTASTNIPVGQLISCKKMDKNHSTFSIKVVTTGEIGAISMGLAPANYDPNRQAGWNSQSIGYHADDGGIFLESGWPNRRTEPCTVGDIMSLEIDFTKDKGFFKKNGKQMIELNLNPNKLSYYAMIGFHSVGESVQILDKALWQVDDPDSEKNIAPPAFGTFKYGNLWISPGDEMKLSKTSSQNLSGWLLLHNPIKDPVGFKVQFGDQEVFGFFQNEKEKDWVYNFKEKINLEFKPLFTYVKWVSLESGRTYTMDDIQALFGDTKVTSSSVSHTHRIPIVRKESNSTVEQLPTRSQMSASQMQNSLCLAVYRNHGLVEEFWIKHGSYQVSVEAFEKNANFILKYPKFPTFNYPRQLQKGMKLIVCLEKGVKYAESVIVEVYTGGKNVAVEYSPPGAAVNTTLCVNTNSHALVFPESEFDVDKAVIFNYETRNTPANVVDTFVQAPHYLLSEGSLKIMRLLHPEWKLNMLRSFSRCVQQVTRLTVQERQIVNASRHILEWEKTLEMTERVYLYTMLPEQLSDRRMAFPNISQIFTDIEVHRLCFNPSELLDIMQTQDEYGKGSSSKVRFRVPVHFVDIPGIKPSQPLTFDLKYADRNNVWTYVALISSKLLLPSYEKFMVQASGDSYQFSRGHLEVLLYRLLQTYTSLCAVYSTTWGGVALTKDNTGNDMKHSIAHKDKENLQMYGSLLESETGLVESKHKLLKTSGCTLCKAHFNSRGNVWKDDQHNIFRDDFFEPYNELVTNFHWSLAALESLPDDFFSRFPNLERFRLGQPRTPRMTKLKSLPPGIGMAGKLTLVEMTNMGLSALPDDFFMSKSVLWMTVTNSPIRQLSKEWPKNSPLEVLVLADLQLESLPEEFGSLHNLEQLELCYNPLTALPESFGELSKLHLLKLIGPPWIKLMGQRSQITRDMYMEFWTQHGSMEDYIGGEEKVIEMFDKYDYNHNGSLDEEEIAALNTELFFLIPRLGIHEINNEVTGGIPPVIYKLRNLSALHLDFQAVTMVPADITRLQNLEQLSLSDSMFLGSLPGPLGHLPNIKSIAIQSCPQLRTPPTEIVSRGFESVKAYLKRLAGGFTECRRTKLMVVGLGGAGKTSLIRALMAKDKKTAGTEKETPTDGIDIKPWTVSSESGQEITYSTWDFAGQAVYYNTHQFFLSKRAVYLLLWSMRQGYEHAGLDFWLSSICCHAPGTPIIVVGTQCDLIPKAEIPEKELLERYPQIASFHRVSSITGIGISDLQKSLLDVTLQQGYMGEKIPKVWLNFENRILSERMKKKNYLKWEVIRQFALDQGIYSERDVKMAVQLLHDLGTIQYFDNDFLRDYVVINPQWIVDVMACVVSAQSSPIQQNHGRFLHEDIPKVWAKYDPELHQWLLRLTEDFDLTFPLPSEPVNIVPCLLPGEQPDDVSWENFGKKEGVRETKMVYRFTYLPSGLFNRAQVRLFQLSDGEKVWKKGSLLTKNKHSALIKQTDNRELVVFVRGPRPENILFLIHEVFESIIEESFNGVSYDLYLPCPDCVEKEGTTDPDMLCAKLIQRAKDLKAPFIQCYKYFHWISMAQLQEKMPADSREMAEFDFHLQQSIVALEELNSDLGVDVAILYSRLDLPQAGDDDALSPLQIRDDIVEWGHTCWFPENIDTVSFIDLSTAIKNCKILIALVSDHFERDRQCADIFLHARETMKKATIVVVLGKSMEWEKKDLGMKIGQQERKLMAKTRSRYECANGRRDELKEWLTEILQGIKEKEVTMPEVFISYCQRNSYLATKNQEKYNESALGYGDPRDLCFRLEHEGKFNCWIDTEYIGKEKKGIFADMAVGIRNSKVFVAFVSDEYAESDNCMMELRFGILNMGLPVVTVVVGTGSKWKQTEVGMLLARAKASEVYLQKENPEGIKVLMQYVGEALTTQKLTEKKNAEASGKDKKKHVKLAEVDTEKKGNSSVAYQEEVELIQRKFMRHILGSIASLDQMPMPRLIVVDFVKDSSSKGKSEEGRESSVGNTKSYRRTQRVPISKKGGRPRSSRDRLNVDENSLEETDDFDDWSTESFCIQVLCEHEQGWHLCPQKFPLAFRNREQLEVFLQKAAPYLYRIYTILKQGPIKLKCFSPGKGKAYLDWIRQVCEDNLDFVEALTHLRSELAKDETKEISGCLARCRLPSGKIVWLCGEHQQMQRVSKLSTGNSGGSYSRKVVLYTEDKLMSERIIESAEYKVLKAGSDKHLDPVKPGPLNPKQPKDEEVVALNDSKKEKDETPDSEGRNKKVGDVESKALNLLNVHDKKIDSDTKSEAILLKEPDKKIDSDTKSEAILLKEPDKKIDSDTKSEAILLKEPDKKIDSDSKSEGILLKGPDKKIDFDTNTEAILIESEKKKIQSDILQSEKDEIKSVRTKFFKRIIQSSEPVPEKHTVGADRPEVPLTKNVVEDFIKEDTTDKIIETIQETNDAEVRNGTHLEDTESANDIEKYQKTQKFAQQTQIEQKEDVKRMLLESDNKAIRKALKASNTSQQVSKSRMVQSTDFRVQLPPNPASKYGSIARGSNVKRLMTQSSATELNKQDVSIAHSKIKSTRSDGGLPTMDASLNITPVKQGSSASSVSSVESRTSGTVKDKKSEVHPLERVRPRKINVRPQSDKDNGKKESGPSFAATGRSVQNQDRSPAGGNQKTSQACSLQ